MGGEMIEDADAEVLSSMWPVDIGNEARKQFNIENPGIGRDMLKDVTIKEDPSVVDFKRLLELTNYSEKGSSQLSYLVKHWQYKHVNTARLINEELDILNKQRQEVELKKQEILEEHRFEEERYAGSRRQLSVLDEVCDIWGRVPKRRNDVLAYNKKLDVDAEYGTVIYWKERAIQLDKMLEASIHREQTLMQKFAISTCTARYGRYIPVRQVTGTRTARYRAVPSKIGRRRPILKEIDRRRSIEKEKGKKKCKRKKEEEGNKEYLASAVLARLPSPPAGRSRIFSRARRQIEA
ncbi:hypothetical protein BHE74_00056565, partial [Ensete ventricosum]